MVGFFFLTKIYMYPIRTRVPYDANNLVASAHTYTTVYLGTYLPNDYTQGNGSHLGVDIVPMAPHDPVFAILDGRVLKAGNTAMEGNYVILEHVGIPDPENPSLTTTLYSVYLHLSAVEVSVGQIVGEGTQIGNTGNTGNSTGEHLHFQIDRATAPFHAYWPFTTAEAQARGLGFFDAVNAGVGLDNAKKFTVSPLEYLDHIGHGFGAGGAGNGPAPSNTTNTISATTTDATIAVAANTTQAPQFGFNDVTANTPYAEAIKTLKEKDIVSGVGGVFQSNASVSRVEFIKMVLLAAKIPPSDDDSCYFNDLEIGAWYVPYINAARDKGIINGYEDGTFKPNAPVNRSEGCKIAVQTLAKSQFDATATMPLFDDTTPNDWCTPYANFAKNHTLLDFGNTFEPQKPLSRAEAASIIAGLL